MMFRKCSLVAILSLYQTDLSIVDAFTASFSRTRQVNHNQFHVANLKLPPLTLPSTFLSMAEEDNQETTEEFVQDETEDGKPNASTEDANDILSSPAFLKRKLEVLQSDITTTEEDLEKSVERLEVAKEEWGPQLEALQNEYSNIQERMSNQNQDGDTDAIVRVVTAILDLLDNFDRASGVIMPETDSEKAIEAAYKTAYQDILDQFEKLGVTEVETLGKEFDYELHQAVMQMPGTEYEEGFICQEFQKGFIMDETLIRPAMVAVAG